MLYSISEHEEEGNTSFTWRWTQCIRSPASVLAVATSEGGYKNEKRQDYLSLGEVL